jgi:hypothetical protein
MSTVRNNCCILLLRMRSGQACETPSRDREAGFWPRESERESERDKTFLICFANIHIDHTTKTPNSKLSFRCMQ